jgi:hypothetical protein
VKAIVAAIFGASLIYSPLCAQDQPPPPAEQPPLPGRAGDAPPPQVQPPPGPGADAPLPPALNVSTRPGAGDIAITPVRLSYTYGDVSFWRPGADDWTPAQINTPLSPGDQLYAPAQSSFEQQIGGRAFVRGGAETQLGLENQEPDFLQFKVTAGYLALDLRSLTPGQTIEVDTPNSEFTVAGIGYYRVDVADNATTFITRRGGHATVTAAGGQTMSIGPNEQVVVQGGDQATVASYPAPQLDAWDRWNYSRTDQLLGAPSTRYVSADVSGVSELDHYGRWRSTARHGRVWSPSQVPSGWTPYSNGRWIWDATYGWTWVDAEPWGWAPSHYGRWVNDGGYWGWTPGPLISAAVYAPAVVGFIGGPNFGISIGIGAPAVGWVPLGWGEPITPWWDNPASSAFPHGKAGAAREWSITS